MTVPFYSLEELSVNRTQLNDEARSILATRGVVYPLTANDERSILLYYHQKINDVCKYCKFTLGTFLTAHLIFSRVHLVKTIVDPRYDLKHYMLASVYLASKIDEQHLAVDAFASKIPGSDRKSIEELEFVLLDWLDFDVFMVLPINSAVSYIVDCFGRFDEQVYKQAMTELTGMYMTDVPHLYSPAICALAALDLTLIKGSKDPFLWNDYVSILSSRLNMDLKSMVDELKTLYSSQGTTVDSRYLKEIDSNLTSCRNMLLSK